MGDSVAREDDQGRQQFMNDLIQVARGEKKADLLLKNAWIVNVFTGTIDSGDVAIYNGRIAGIGNYEAEKEIDLRGSYLTPGFIDSHVHIESSMVSPEEFASTVIKHGTTTVVADPHEIANVAGKTGIAYMLEASKSLPVSIYFMLPSCVPATHLETSGATLSASDLKSLFKEKSVLGLAEMMNFPGVLHRDPIVLEKLESFESKLIDGHAPGLSGKDLCAYMAVGIYSDHESTTPEEALEKLRLGMYIMLREGTAAKDLKKLLPIIDDFTAPRCLLSTDDRHPEDLIEEGGIDLLLRMAMKEGVHPIRAIQLATLNPANYFGLKDRGAISPGRIADLVVLNDLEAVKVSSVLKDGRMAVREGELLLKPKKKAVPAKIKKNIKIEEVKPGHFEIPRRRRGKCRVIDIIPNEIITKQAVVPPKTKEGRIISDTERDIIKIAIIERHSGTGNMFVG
ncbi:MAG TPA: adenine deaminase, partial [Actinobacteria bacterium]|nr:adenine deaminase [Actinomycetota bacterium]